MSKHNKSSLGFEGAGKTKIQLKWVVIIMIAIISIGSLYYTNTLVNQVKLREKKLISLYANTLEYLANQQVSAEFNLIFEEIIVSNKSIPVVVTDEIGNPLSFRNIPKAENKSRKARNKILRAEIKKMEAEREPLLVSIKSNGKVTGYQFIYYKNSDLLNKLQYYPLIELSIVGIFAIISFIVFSYSKSNEQDRVWVGLAKETAHQLGTPLSSLMAWVEYMKSDARYQDSEMIVELEKDLKRLYMITQRFSNIGSDPVLESTNIFYLIEETIGYLRNRISSKVDFSISTFPNPELEANINKPLFEWVIENICKNAVDAMGGEGKIDIKILQANEGHVFIDIHDSGRGMTKSQMSKIFTPGFTTKRRGWGLGLALAKRIIESYHKGKIYVKSSEPNEGSVFRISLKS